MRRSEEEFKAELMLRVKKYRDVQRRRKRAWTTVGTAAAGLVIVTVLKVPGIFGMETESLRETAPARTETSILENLPESGEEYYYTGVTEPAVIDGLETESLQVLSVRVESRENGSIEYSDPAVTGQWLAVLQSFQSAEGTHATAQTETKTVTQAESEAETKVDSQTEPKEETPAASGPTEEAYDAAESESRTAGAENEPEDSEKTIYTVTVQYADGTEYCYTLQQGSDYGIILGEDGAQMSLTMEQWERLDALLEDISAKGGRS